MTSFRSRPAFAVALAFALRGCLAAAVLPVVLIPAVGDAWARPGAGKVSTRTSSHLAEARAAAQDSALDATIARRKAAYQKFGDPRLLFELGELHLRSGRTVEAQRFYNAYLQHQPPGRSRRATEERLRAIGPAMAWAAAPTTTPPLSDSAPLPLVPPTASTEQPLAPSAPGPAQAPMLPPSSSLPAQSPLPPQPATLTPPSLFVAAPAPAPPGPLEPAVDRDARLPVPGWVPVFGAALTGGLLAGAIVGGHIANDRYDELRQSCGRTDAGCSPERIEGLRSLARVANVLWMAAAVAGAGTATVVFVDAHAAGMSKTWSF